MTLTLNYALDAASLFQPGDAFAGASLCGNKERGYPLSNFGPPIFLSSAPAFLPGLFISIIISICYNLKLPIHPRTQRGFPFDGQKTIIDPKLTFGVPFAIFPTKSNFSAEAVHGASLEFRAFTKLFNLEIKVYEKRNPVFKFKTRQTN